MGNFKLGSNRPNVLKENGFLNKSPFTDNGNTMAFNNGDTDPPKKSLQEQADADAASAKKVLLKPGDKGYDPSKKASYVQTGSATKPTTFTEEGNKAYANLSQEEKDAQDKKWKEIQKKNAEIFSYEDKDKEIIPDDTPEITYNTTENPRKKKTQDYLEGKSVKMFTPIKGHRMEKLSKAISRIGGGRTDVTKFGQKNRISKKDLANQIANYDKKTLADREKNPRRPSPNITTTEQREYMEKYGQLPNKFGAGRSLLYDTKTGIGQTGSGQTFKKDEQGNMQVQTLNKKNKVIESQSTSPENDINPEKTINKANATNLSGRETVVSTSKV